MNRDSVGIFILPSLIILPLALAVVRELNSISLTLGISVVSIVSGSLIGLLLLILNRHQNKQLLRFLFALCIAGLVCGYLDMLSATNLRAIDQLLPNFDPGARSAWVKIAMVAVVLIVAVVTIAFCWFHKQKTIEFLLIVFLFVSLPAIYSAFSGSGQTLKTFDRASDQTSDELSIYIVFDAMIGSAGLHTDISENVELADEVDAFFEKYEFAHFRKAFSRHHYTMFSIPATLNGSSSGIPDVREFFSVSNNRFTITKNGLFDTFTSKSRPAYVYQTQYLNYCNHAAVVQCKSIENMNPFSRYLPKELPPYSVYLSSLFHFEKALNSSFAVRYFATELFKPIHWLVKKLDPVQYQINSSNLSFNVDLTFAGWFDDFVRNIAEKRGGSHFGHFLSPHFPFRLDAECKPALENFPTHGFDKFVEAGGLSSEAANQKRKELYSEYRGQMRCVLKKLAYLFDTLKENGLYENAKITIFGDHGSRLSNAFSSEIIDQRDMKDNYSVIFVTKGRTAGSGRIDDRMISVQQLLLAHEFDRPEEQLSNTNPTVVLWSEEDQKKIEVPMPAL